jgi:hypothetical protein
MYILTVWTLRISIKSGSNAITYGYDNANESGAPSQSIRALDLIKRPL